MNIEDVFRVELSSVLPIYSDKCILPQRILSNILSIHDESNLPHPLIFKIRDANNDIQIYVGVKEFLSPEDDLLIVPDYISRKLKGSALVSIELQVNIPKASVLSLKPLHFYSDINNWKYFLEDKLSLFYTTLTKGESLIIESNNLRYELLVENLNENVACIIDTDITLDIIPLDEHKGSQQLEFKAFSGADKDIITLDNHVEISKLKPLTNPLFSPNIYRIDLSESREKISLMLEADTNDQESIFNVDLIVGFDKMLNMESFIWSTLDQDSDIRQRLISLNRGTENKVINLDLESDRIKNKLARYNPDDEETEYEKWLYIIAFAWHHDCNVRLTLSTSSYAIGEVPVKFDVEEGQAICSNCRKHIPSNQLHLHEAFCFRNNIKCSCGQLFLRKIPGDHWHCEKCPEVGNGNWLQEKHQKLYHHQYSCHKCDLSFTYDNYIDLITQHMGTCCPNKLHECKFCHLVVPQDEATYQDNFENLTHHENLCGNKTTECYRCSKILRRKDLVKHLKIHNLEKVQIEEHATATFSKCSNVNCVNLLQGSSNALLLCDICFGPFYNNQLDSSNFKLQSSIERKYMMQLTKGCGNAWCQNQYCKSGNVSLSQNPKPIKELIKLINTELFTQISSPILPINKGRATTATNKLYFCVNESILQKMALLHSILSENRYKEEMVYKALSHSSSEEAARTWLSNNALLVR